MSLFHEKQKIPFANLPIDKIEIIREFTQDEASEISCITHSRVYYLWKPKNPLPILRCQKMIVCFFYSLYRETYAQGWQKAHIFSLFSYRYILCAMCVLTLIFFLSSPHMLSLSSASSLSVAWLDRLSLIDNWMEEKKIDTVLLLALRREHISSVYSFTVTQ